MKQLYQYEALLVRVIDGDTAEFDIRIGFDISVRKKIRFLGVNTPEMRGGTPETKTAALLAKTYSYNKLVANPIVIIATRKPDSFGRWLGEVFLPSDDFKSLSELLIENNHGVPFMVEK